MPFFRTHYITVADYLHVFSFPPGLRLDKIHKTEKEESHYDCVRCASKEERDGKVDIAGKHIKEQTENNFVSRKRCAND
jgi:hypothetical protein